MDLLNSKIDSCQPSSLNLEINKLSRNNTISTSLHNDNITIISSEQSNDGIKLQTKEKPKFEIKLDQNNSNNLQLDHMKLSFSNVPNVDGESFDGSLILEFHPSKSEIENKHILRMIILLSQGKTDDTQEHIDFIANDELLWNNLFKDNSILDIHTIISENILPNEIYREGIFFIEKSDFKVNPCNSELVSQFIYKTPVLVTNDIRKLKKQFITDASLFTPSKYDLISEVSLVKFIAGNQESLKDLLNFRKQVSSDTQNNNSRFKKDKFGFMRFKGVMSNSRQKRYNNLMKRVGKKRSNMAGKSNDYNPSFNNSNNFRINNDQRGNRKFRFKERSPNYSNNYLKQRLAALRSQIKINHTTRVNPQIQQNNQRNQNQYQNNQNYPKNNMPPPNQNQNQIMPQNPYYQQEVQKNYNPNMPQPEKGSYANSYQSMNLGKFNPGYQNQSGVKNKNKMKTENFVDPNLPIAKNDQFDKQGNVISYDPTISNNNNQNSKNNNSDNSTTKLAKVGPNSDMIMEPEDSNNIHNYKIFDYMDQDNARNQLIKQKDINGLKFRQKQHVQTDPSSFTDPSKISSLDDIKNFKFVETEDQSRSKTDSSTSQQDPFTQSNSIPSQEEDNKKDIGTEGTIDFHNSTEHLMDFKRAQKHLNDIYTSAKKDKDAAPKGLLANFKIGTSINPNGSFLVELTQFRSSLENVQNKGYGDALEDLGLDPRNALFPSTRDQYNHVNDIDNTNRDYVVGGNDQEQKSNSNFRFKQVGNRDLEFMNNSSPIGRNTADFLASTRSRSMPFNKSPVKEPGSDVQTDSSDQHNKWYHPTENGINDEIFDNSFIKKEQTQKSQLLKVEQAKNKQKVDDSKKEYLNKIKKNIVDLGRYLKSNKVTNGPLWDMFNSMQDSQQSLLKEFSHKVRSVTEVDNQNEDQNSSSTNSDDDADSSSEARFSQKSRLKSRARSKTHKHLNINSDKWHKIQKQLPESRQADFNIQDVTGRTLNSEYENIFNKHNTKGKGIVDLKDERAIQDGKTLDKKDQEVLQSTQNKLFTNIKDEQQKYDDNSKYQVNYQKLGFKESDKDKSDRFNNELNFKPKKRNLDLHSHGKINAKLTEDQVEAALRRKDQVHIGGNNQNDNVFRRAKLQDDSDRISTVITPTINRRTPSLEWKGANFKMANGQYKHHDPVENQEKDFGFNKAEKDWNDQRNIDLIKKE